MIAGIAMGISVIELKLIALDRWRRKLETKASERISERYPYDRRVRGEDRRSGGSV